MNIPSINPQLQNTISGAIVDYVFVIHVDKNPPITADVECYIDEVWSQEDTMKSMSIQNARDWWNTLVHKGYERVLTP